MQTNPYEFPIQVNQLDEKVACDTLHQLRQIFNSRMIFGTTEADKYEGRWQLSKFKSINEMELDR